MKGYFSRDKGSFSTRVIAAILPLARNLLFHKAPAESSIFDTCIIFENLEIFEFSFRNLANF